ncbi:DUF1573 domain-containing protein [Flavobacterium sp. MFBS3-15]|uniref:DUF1573 domain-containing protein n=1 Tax=Flavobacterium sp. MFBS3-15 TaxID=2989816 RepID=UPI00223692AC|nr:DUF1573 domain-containing protein [Flavobacterium sp. MFBS3-15]MCW4469232.1 DUF1573 domain-containing protein [Flavobacterium sp. MFBS3-15]
MKTLKLSMFAVAGALLLSFSANAQQTSVAKKGTAKANPAKIEAKPAVKAAATNEAPKNMTPSGITWKEDSFTFGDIEKGKPVSHEFTFKNTTKQTVLITNVKAQCGCTATNYTKTPIKPGETGVVTATYNAANPGAFSKTVTVTTNDSDVNKILTIKGKVIAPENEAAPAPATHQ